MNPILIHKSDSTIFANVNKFLTFFIDTPLATKEELKTKQDKGNYALVEDIPSGDDVNNLEG